MADQYLYLLMNCDGTAFKIGVSVSPVSRIASLPQCIDIEKSFQIRIMEGRRAVEVEKILHYLFRDDSFAMPPGDGYTEWFAVKVFSEALKFLEENKNRLGIGEFEIIQVQNKRLSIPESPDYSLEDRRRLWREAKEKRFLDRRELAIKHNYEVIERFRIFIREMVERSSMIGVLVGDAPFSSHLYVYFEGCVKEMPVWNDLIGKNGLRIEGRKVTGAFNLVSSVTYDANMGMSEIHILTGEDELHNVSIEEIPGIDDLRTIVQLYLSPTTGDKKECLLKHKYEFEECRKFLFQDIRVF